MTQFYQVHIKLEMAKPAQRNSNPSEKLGHNVRKIPLITVFTMYVATVAAVRIYWMNSVTSFWWHHLLFASNPNKCIFLAPEFYPNNITHISSSCVVNS